MAYLVWIPYAIVLPFAFAAIFVNQIDKLLTRFERS